MNGWQPGNRCESAHLRRIRPVEVHMYSIDRPVPEQGIRLVPPERLREIAEQLTADTGVLVRPFFANA